MELFNALLVNLCEAGLLPEVSLVWITRTVDAVSVLLGFGPQMWG